MSTPITIEVECKRCQEQSDNGELYNDKMYPAEFTTITRVTLASLVF